MTFVGSNTLGVKTDKGNTKNSKTKEHGGGGDRCDGAPDVSSVGLLEHLAPPPLSLFTLPSDFLVKPLNQALAADARSRAAEAQRLNLERKKF